MCCFRGKVELVIEASGVEGAQFRNPKVFSSQEKVTHLFFRHVLLGDLFYYYDTKVPVEIVSRLVEVPVDGYRVGFGHIVSVLVHAPVCPLRLYLSNVLFFVALEAKTLVNSVFRSAVCLMAYLITFPRSAGEKCSVNYMSTAHAVRPTVTGATSPPVQLPLSYDSVSADLRLSDQVP